MGHGEDVYFGAAKVGGCLRVDAGCHGVGCGDKELGLDGFLEERVGQDVETGVGRGLQGGLDIIYVVCIRSQPSTWDIIKERHQHSEFFRCKDWWGLSVDLRKTW